MSKIAMHLFLLLVFPPFLLGLITRVKAVFAGRSGPPLLQPYFDIWRLLKKGSVISTTTTWVFVAGPLVTLVCIFAASLFIPLGPLEAPISFNGDFILFAYLFGLARFFTVSAALDTGSAFEGMGASREATFAYLSEPALFFVFMALVQISGTMSLEPMLVVSSEFWMSGDIASCVLLGLSLFLIILVENSRIPVDDPNTHLELTMIHEVMVLDHSGPLLGIIHYGAAVKFFLMASLFAGLVAPAASGDAVVDGAIYLAWVLLVSVAVGVTESVMARLRMLFVPRLILGSMLLSCFGFLLLWR